MRGFFLRAASFFLYERFRLQIFQLVSSEQLSMHAKGGNPKPKLKPENPILKEIFETETDTC